MRRFFLELSYDGSHYHGWQVQPNARSIQEEVNKALSTVLSSDIEVVGAGRTDTGVHARQLFCHFDAHFPDDEAANIQYRLNSLLPKDISVLGIAQTDKEAHTRFDAVKRSYEYRISTRKDPFELNRAWIHSHSLDIERMNAACEELKKHRHFKAFSKSGGDAKTDLCEIKSARWIQNDHILQFEISADRFLRNMVRAIVGTMVDIGSCKIDIEEFNRIIESRNRSEAGLSVPACGLYLSAVEYPYSLNFLCHV